MKQTAIEWLIDQLIPKDQHEGIMDIIQEAKEMEKQQIIDAYKVGKFEAKLPIEEQTTGKQYYKETYKQD